MSLRGLDLMTREERNAAWDELVVRLRAAEQEREDAIAAFNVVAAKLDAAEERLTWISDPSYVGNYSPEEVVEIYRKWAKDGLAAVEGNTP